MEKFFIDKTEKLKINVQIITKTRLKNIICFKKGFFTKIGKSM